MSVAKMRNLLGVGDIFDGFVPEFDVDLQGWNSDCKAFDILSETTRPMIAFDVGVWKGGSTIAMAQRMRDAGTPGFVIAIDTFLGSPEHWLPGPHGDFRTDLIFHRGSPRLYWQFLSNVVHSGLQDYVIPLRQTSTNAATILGQLGVSADLIHIDAAHDYRSVYDDLTMYWNLVRNGGAMVADDYIEEWPAVLKAVDDFCATVSCQKATVVPKAILTRPGHA